MNEMKQPGERRSRRTYSGMFKAQVVWESMDSKRSLEEIARHYGVHPNQIKNWKCLLRKRLPEVFEDKRRSAKPTPFTDDIITPCGSP